MNLYPIVEGYRRQTAVGLQAEFSDPMSFHQFTLSGSYSPDAPERSGQRWHVLAGYQRYDLSAQFRWNPASFYDLVGATQASHKGYGTSLDCTGRSSSTSRARWSSRHARVTGAGSIACRTRKHRHGAGFNQLLETARSCATRICASPSAPRTSSSATSGGLGRQSRACGRRAGAAAAWTGFPLVDGGLDVAGPSRGSATPRCGSGRRPGFDPERAGRTVRQLLLRRLRQQRARRGRAAPLRDPQQFPGAGIDAIAASHFARGMVDWNLPALRFRRAGTLALYASWARLSLFGSGLTTNFADTGSSRGAAARRKLADAGAQSTCAAAAHAVPAHVLVRLGLCARATPRPTHEWMASLKVL